jgi:hypothetical protein
VNTNTSDPDNFMLSEVVTKPGEHYVFSEVMLHGTTEMQHGMHYTDGIGDAKPVKPKNFMFCDKSKKFHFVKDGKIVAERDAEFRATFQCEPILIDDFKSAHFSFSWDKKVNGIYVPHTVFEPWLQMAGHAIAISYEGGSVGSVIFRHMHAMQPPEGSNTIHFTLDKKHGGIEDGRYKIWAQFKVEGNIFTLPANFEFYNSEL